ncbi:hypothetical protein [Nocardioides perillae]|uniref:GAF domain-containing protein n=1 Tax=Nocardioides perillae TaxID=1119534 RepID=A0A7Y9RSB2_9ACTN|nr:hypothetical protein [Nocardioides perillae]NYG54361.1 hypothetical protein [Nocardioides perillae]
MHRRDDAAAVPRPRRSTEGGSAPAGTLVGAVDDAVELVVDRLVESVEGCLAGLEAMAAEPVADRLEYVARCAATAWGAPRLWVGSVDGDRLVTRRCRSLRPVSPVSAVDATGPGGTTDAGTTSPAFADCADGVDLEERLGPLGDRDALLAALEGGSLLARPGDGSGLGGWLPELGLGAVVAAGGYDHDARQWLVAVLMRDSGADAAIARLALTSLVQAALAMPVSAHRR